jgi:PTS system mannose-specific IIA component
MIGIVVVSHGRLAQELVSAAEHVVGRLRRVRSISIEADEDLDSKREQILVAVKACDAGKGVVVLTDMFGGTPSNLVLSIRGSVPMEIVSGANLPMMIKLAEVREVLSLEEAAQAAAEGGRKYVTIASELLAKLP